MSTQDSISILTHRKALATKRWYRDDAYNVQKEDYGAAKWFACAIRPVGCFDDLAMALLETSQNPYAYIIRGEPIPGRDLTDIRRTKNVKEGDQPGFREVPRRWMMIDADKIRLTPEEIAQCDLLTEAGCERAARYLAAKLPPELRTARCLWQLSSSAGMSGKGVSAHFWFWLDRPMNGAELVRWGDQANDIAGEKIIDLRVFDTVQVHYVATPVFESVPDPVACRMGIFDGTDEACLPFTYERAHSYRNHLDQLRRANVQETNAHLLRATASYFTARTPDAPANELLAEMRGAVDFSIETRGGDLATTVYTDAKLEEYVESARAFARSKAAEGQNLALNKDGTPKATIENIRAVIASSPEWEGVLRYNERKDKIYIRTEPPFDASYAGTGYNYPREYTDTDDRRLVSWLARKCDLQVTSGQVSEAVDVIGHQHAHDPVREYLQSLAWDGVARLDTWLTTFLGVAPDTEGRDYVRRVGRMWLIAAVARALDPGCKADCVLILEGRQGARKSSALRDLAGGVEYFREGLGDWKSTDTARSMSSAWIIELREMVGITNREAEQVKGFLDQQNDNYRAAYGRRHEDHLRRCVFAATTNEAEYLRDATGARRYWPVLVTDVDLDALATHRDQLWAEAVHLYRLGEAWYVEADDPDFVREQEARYDEDHWEPFVAEAIEKGAKSINMFKAKTPAITANETRLTGAQVLEHVFDIDKGIQKKSDIIRIGKIMTRLGWKKQHTKNGNCWSIK